MENDQRYAFCVEGALAKWIDKDKRTSELTLIGTFPTLPPTSRYTMQFSSDIAFALCKKLEKEGVADLTTTYIKEQIIGERFE